MMKTTRRNFIGAAGTALAGGALASALPKNRIQPNLLFVISDQQRRHALGFMKQDSVRTPHTDLFAKEAVVCTNAISATPLCGPWRSAMLTGLLPTTTRMTTNNSVGSKPGQRGFGSELRDAGYETGYVGKWHVWAGSGMENVPPEYRLGFDQYWIGCNCNHDCFHQRYFDRSGNRLIDKDITQAGQTRTSTWQPFYETERGIDFIENKHSERDEQKPFALFVCVVPPHNTHSHGIENPPLHEGELPPKTDFDRNLVYAAPEQYEALYQGDQPRRKNVPQNYAAHKLPGYFGAVTGVDECFGKLLETLDRPDPRNPGRRLRDTTVVIYASDHGDQMGSHGLVSKTWFYEESIGVPFLIRWPDGLKPGTSDVLFSETDILPSVLGLLGISPPPYAEGRDVSSHWKGRPGPEPEHVVISYFNPPEDVNQKGDHYSKYWRGLRTKRCTFVTAGEWYGAKIGGFRALFDNEKDPDQLNPIHPGPENQALFDSFERTLKKELERRGDPWADKLKA